MKRAGRVAIAGRPNVGKSTLLNALLGERLAIVSAKPQTTRDRILGILTRKETQFCFFDTPGMHEAKTRLGHHMNAVARESIEGVDAIVLVVDRAIGDIEREILKTNIPVVLALNKIDLIKNKIELLPILQNASEAHDFAAIVPISATKVDGLDRLLGEIEKLLPEAEHPYEKD